MSAIRRHPTSSAISRKGLKSIARGNAEPPVDEELRPVLPAEVAHLVQSIRSSSRRTPYGTIR